MGLVSLKEKRMIKTLALTPSDIKRYTEEEMWALPHHTPVEVTFDDGIKQTGSLISLAVSSYYWRIAFKYDLPVNSNLWIGDEGFTDGLHTRLLWEAIEPTSWDEVRYDKEKIWAYAYEYIYNDLYIAIGKYLSIYMSGVTMDEINIYLQDPDIMAAVNSIKVLDDVAPAHAIIQNVARTKYKDTTFYQDVANGTVKPAQLTQGFSRGVNTDNDSSIFLMASARGFAMGLREMASVAKESCSAAKAILAQKDPVREASTQDRRMQLICGVIQTLVPGDCGTTESVKMNIPTDKAGLKEIGSSLQGMWQVLDDGALRLICKGDAGVHFHGGDQIKIRTTLGCKHLHKQAVCEKCYGRLAYSLSYGSNPGFVSAVAMNSRIVQLIISTKHLDFVTSTFRAILKGRERDYFRLEKDRATDIFLRDQVWEMTEKADEELWLAIPTKSAPGISIVNTLRNVEIPIASISSLDTEFHLFAKGEINQRHIDRFNLKCRTNTPSLSRDMLKFLKGDNWTVSPDGKAIHINLAHWDKSKPIISFPLKHENMMEFSNSVKKFLTSSDDKSKEISANTLCSYTSVSEALNDTYALLNTNLKGLYMGHIATLLAASRITSSEADDYSLPKSMHEGEFAPYPTLFKERSLSGALLNGFIEQHSIGNLNSYTRDDRMPLFTDDFIMIENNRYNYDWE